MKIQPNWNVEEDCNVERGTSLLGKVVYCHYQEPMKNLSYALSTALIIGWDAHKNKNDTGYYTFTSLSDGMTISYNLQGLIAVLNKQPYVLIPSSVLRAIMGKKVPLR